MRTLPLVRPLQPFALTLLLLLAPVEQASAQLARGFVMQSGMETAWKSQIQIPYVGRGLVSSHLWASPTITKQYAVVTVGQRTVRIPASLPDRDGKAIGIEGAKSQALAYATKLTGSAEGHEVQTVTVPELRLYLTTSDGLVQCLNAETGEMLWSASCGPATAPAYASSVSPEGIAVLHGQKLYLLDLDTGRHRFSQSLYHATSIGLATCGNLAFVVDIKGRVRSYGLTEKVTNPYRYVLSGHTIGNPVSLANQQFGAIATDAGYMYVFAGGDQPSEWIRYESNASITGSLAAGNDAFYVANSRGALSKVSSSERLGRILWEYRSGELTTAPPLVLGESVFVASEAGTLASVNDADGFANWTLPGAAIQQPIAKAGNRVFCTDNKGHLLAVDAETGMLVALSNTLRMAKPVMNQLNDRVYLVTNAGQVQCLRPVGGELPTMIEAATPSATDPDQANQAIVQDAQADEKGDVFGVDAGGDPFGNADPNADPFGDPAPAGEDPFGGSGTMEDPFGGSGGGSEDPFGGSDDDPFGSGSL
jgi:outer membrane protein assembly factor BamB